jgi:hypothetical protein
MAGAHHRDIPQNMRRAIAMEPALEFVTTRWRLCRGMIARVNLDNLSGAAYHRPPETESTNRTADPLCLTLFF